MKAIGHTIWAVPGGHIPLRSTGPEPAFTSRDELVFLNTGDDVARVTMTMFYADRDPVSGYELRVGARRVRRVRVNDLIDPEALPLDIDYGAVIESDIPIVVQFCRIDTSQSALALANFVAFAADG